MVRLLKVLVLATALVPLSAMVVAPASAQHHGGGHGHAGHGHHGGHSHTTVAVGLGFGWPWWGWPAYAYGPAYYYYPSPYYYPPYAAYAGPATVSPTSQCHDYHGDATIDASGAPFYGRACLEADGRWHIVN